jgi:hypothetical protein
MIWTPLPAIAALRQDLSVLGPDALQDSTSSSGWLALTLILERQARRSEMQKSPLAERLKSILDEIEARPRPRLEDHVAASPPSVLMQRIRAVAEEMEEAGALRLAESTLASAQDSAEALQGWAGGSELAIERGRTLAQRARVAWKAGATEVAADRYRRVGGLGIRARLPELMARAKLGHAALAQIAGDWPAVGRRARAARRLATAVNRPALVELSHHFLMVAAAEQQKWSSALVHGWEAYRGAAGDPEREAERLLNLAQLLLLSGRSEAARAGFVASLERGGSLRLVLPALGGLAAAGARMGDAATVNTAAEELFRASGGSALPFQTMSALMELGSAFALMGDFAGIESVIEKARPMAALREAEALVARLRELQLVAHRRERATAPAASVPLSPRGEAVASAVLSLAA